LETPKIKAALWLAILFLTRTFVPEVNDVVFQIGSLAVIR